MTTTTTTTRGVRIRRLDALDERTRAALAGVLIDCVDGGASVSFMPPLSQARAEAFWQEVAASLSRGERMLFVAEDDETGEIVGTVQVTLRLAENQPQRGELVKMLVHRRGRRRGVGAALLAAAESAASEAGKRLLVLDTVSDSDGERLYARHGWQRLGSIEDYALMPDGTPCAATILYKHL